MKFFLTTIAVFLVLAGFAQHPDFWTLDEDSGLPSNVVYDLLEDSEGYIWIGTDRGLVRYGGQQIETFTAYNQKSLAITGLHEDSLGRIWGVNFSQQVFYVASDSMIELKLPTEKKIQGHIKTVLIGDMLYVYSYTHADRLNTKTMEWEVDFYQDHWPLTNGTERKLLYSISGEEGSLAMSFSKLLQQIKKDALVHQLQVPKKPGYHRSSWFAGSQILIPRGFLPLLKFDSETGDTLSIPVSHIFHSTSTRVLVCSGDGAGNLWLCTSEGARTIMPQNPEINNRLYFPENQVSRVIQDREGNWWFSTLQHGVKVIPEVEVVLFNSDNSSLEITEVSSLGVHPDGGVLVGSFDGRVQRVLADGNVHSSIDLKIRKEVNGFVNFQDQTWAFGERIISLETLNVKSLGRPISIKQVQKLDENTLAIVSSEGFALADFSSEFPTLPDAWKLEGFVDMHGIRLMRGTGMRKFQTRGIERGFYLSSTNGLNFYTQEGKSELLAADSSSIYSLDMTLDSHGMLWVSTVSHGILAFDGTELKQTISPDLFEEKIQFSDLELKHQKIWVASNMGLYRIDLEDMEFEKFDVCDGLPTNSINDLVIADGYVWLATMKGLVRMPEDHSSINSVTPSLSFRKVSVNDNDIKELTDLKYNQNNVAFELTPISMRSQGSAKVKYRLSGMNQNWLEVPIAENEIRFLALAPGSYVFEAKVVNEDGFESELISRSFTIARPFWQTWWFYLLIILVVGAIISGVFMFRMREIRKRDAVQHDLRVSELTALKAQMNPHFVFNALNSIQDYVLTNQTELANDYLGKFARLMRKTLDQSQQITVALSEELELLKLYLELEAIRFEDEFDYKISVDDELNSEQIEIPSMIVQPFVENAIKHGLLHKKEDRQLLVDFKMTNSTLECRIEDNGIGLEASRKMNEGRSKSHRSFGTGAVKKRLALLNEGRKDQISVSMTDITNPSKGISGTHVLLRIPTLNDKQNA